MPSEQNADRHLLYGLLALQNGLITQRQLVDAFRKWTRDKSVPLDQILETDGAINTVSGDALRHLVDMHVGRQDGDVQESLIGLSGSDLSDVTAELKLLDDSELYRSLAAVHDRRQHLATPRDSGYVRSGERFRILRPLPGAKGGMGEISVAVDEELGRRVALKQILLDKADHVEYRMKFQVEAEVTGNLEHPGIVPIYGLGTGVDGRPYYAMRLVHGDNLQAKIKQFHAATQPRGPDYNSVEFRALIDRLIDVAQAISYAHSRGVLHRDLKPGNILVGEYGETLVIDWGLARVPQIDEAAAASGTEEAQNSATPLHVRSGSQAHATIQGQALGTVGYAPPEQLDGRIELISERSDVYGLGAILYQMLVGHTPVHDERRDRQVEDLIRDTIAGAITPPRRLQRTLPKSLSAICMKALERDPADRYESVEMFIAEIKHWQADQAVLASPDSLADRVMRLARRYRTAALATAAALVGIAVVAGSALVVVNRARVNETAARINETNARVRETAAREEAEGLATEKAELARRNQTVVDSFVAAFRSADPVRPGVTSKMTAIQVLEQALAQMETDEALASDELSKATLLSAIGTSLLSLGEFAQAISAYEETVRLQKAQLGPKHADTLFSMNQLATAYREARQLELALPLYEATLERRRTTLGPDHTETLTSIANLATGYHAAGRLQDAQTLFEEAFRLTTAKLGPAHPQTLSSMGNLAISYRATGRLEEAIALYEEALPLTRSALGAEHPQTLTCLQNLALAYQSVGREEDALPIYEEAYRGRKNKLGDVHPQTLISMTSLATCYQELNRLADALPLFEESLKLSKEKLGPEHPLTLATMGNLGFGYQALGRLEEAIPLHDETLRLTEARLGRSHPSTVNSIEAVVGARMEARNFEEAKSLVQEWLGHLDVRKTPTSVARGRVTLAVCHLELDQIAEAIATANSALEINEISDLERLRARTVLAAARGQQGEDGAEEQLLEAYQSLRPVLSQIIAHRRWYVARACERIVRYYEAAEQPDKVRQWQAELDDVNAEVERLRTNQ